MKNSCLICGKATKWRSGRGYAQTCSVSCSNKNRNNKLLQEKAICKKNGYDYDEVIRKTSFLPSDVEISSRIYCYINKLDDHPKCKTCGKKTKYYHTHKRYSFFCSPKCSNRDKSVRNKMVNKIINNKFSIKTIRRLNNPKFLNKLHEHYGITLGQISKMLNVSHNVVPTYYKNHGLKAKRVSSFYENELSQFLNIDIEKNTRKIIKPFELDIYIPTKNIAIEYNGTYWHARHDRNYHQNKTLMCLEKGIQLFHVFDFEWTDTNKREIWKSLLNYKIGQTSKKIYARKTNIIEIDRKTANDFFEENHLLGRCQTGKIYYGLEYDNKIVSTMSFGIPRFNKKYDCELIRFCSLRNTQVVGGASKLFKHFNKKNNISKIISYANLRYSSGDIYEKLGFKKLSISKPNYFYSNSNNILTRYMCRKNKLSKILDNYNEEYTEEENMLQNGYYKLYDSGNIIYEFIQQ
jgi:endogenous inhibitor of DNA gyrase (YacG/DUF329 family)